MKLTRIALLLFSAATAFPIDNVRSAEADDRPHGPPAAAFDACAGRSSGDSCTVTFRDQTIVGTCKTIAQDDRLICVPDQAPPGPPPDRSSP
jgi:hypothetical protein